MKETKNIILSERQHELVRHLQNYHEILGISSVNKIVVKSLIKKGVVKMIGANHITLTELGKNIEI